MKRKRQRNPGPPKNSADRRIELLGEISEVLVDYPDLRVTVSAEFPIVVHGRLTLESSRGPFDAYEIRIELDENFPLSPPLVSESGGRIPEELDRHASVGLCLEVWPVWLANNPSPTFRSVLEGPIRNFLISQTVFELTGEWPFGERAHGDAGTIDAISELVGVDPPDFRESALLVTALFEWPKGHNLCRCGSGRPFRECHRPELSELRERLPKKVIETLVAAMWRIYERREAMAAAS